MITTEERIQNDKKKAENDLLRDRAFHDSLEKPSVRFILSQLKMDSKDEGVRILFREIFDSGYGHGLGEIVQDMASAMLKSMKNEKKGS